MNSAAKFSISVVAAAVLAVVVTHIVFRGDVILFAWIGGILFAAGMLTMLAWTMVKVWKCHGALKELLERVPRAEDTKK